MSAQSCSSHSAPSQRTSARRLLRCLPCPAAVLRARLLLVCAMKRMRISILCRCLCAECVRVTQRLTDAAAIFFFFCFLWPCPRRCHRIQKGKSKKQSVDASATLPSASLRHHMTDLTAHALPLSALEPDCHELGASDLFRVHSSALRTITACIPRVTELDMPLLRARACSLLLQIHARCSVRPFSVSPTCWRLVRR